jgi:GT2 family glycosyltransferase
MKTMIAIPNYSKSLSDIRMLNRCIKSILQNESICADNDLWIFDDGSPYLDLDLITHKRVIRRSNNLGYSATINDALKTARKYCYSAVLTVNSDVELLSPFLNRLEKIMLFDPKIAVVGGLLLYPNGRVQSAGISLTEDGAPIEHSKNDIYAHTAATEVNQPRYMHIVTGALQLIRLDPLQDIGFYDTGFSMSYEDVEFCYRTWRQGYRVFYDPHVKAIHAESVSRGYHVGQRELSSYNRWLSLFTKTTAIANQKRVDSLNQKAQLESSSRQKISTLMREALRCHPKRFSEAHETPDQHSALESHLEKDETHKP